MKTSAWPFFAVVSAAVVIGCGGGGGGGTTTGTSGTSGLTTGLTTGTTTGSTTGGGATTISGRVIPEGSQNQGLPGVQIKVFTANGMLLATGTTAADGRFVIQVAPSAARFHLDQIPTGYYKTYFYLGKIYTALISTCSAPLPSIVEGTDNALPADVRVPDTTFPPPPPPTGCP